MARTRSTGLAKKKWWFLETESEIAQLSPAELSVFRAVFNEVVEVLRDVVEARKGIKTPAGWYEGILEARRELHPRGKLFEHITILVSPKSRAWLFQLEACKYNR